ncbi:unnamed protein product [Soboliphyme baturini]|uniref:Mcm10 domain-containing protein n=1 Tax=Soboliphyme baturini TaxID=241478 RepID=A0A183I8T7_9BILA|nr:unnamed protein product [Soboliphyme baturini]
MTREQIMALLNKTSTHEAELRSVDQERELTYFKVMECKERNEKRLSEIMELKDCKVITCKKCDYTWHAQSDLCKQKGHKVTHHVATKRFFRCRECYTRFVLYQPYPTKPCSNCRSTNIVRVSMKEERKGLKTPCENMKALAVGPFKEADI